MTSATTVIGRRSELSRLLSGSGFIFGCRIVGAGATFVVQVLLARWMGAAELGVYALAFSWCILLATLSTGGFRLAAMRFIGEGLARDDAGYIGGFIRRSGQFVAVASLLVAFGGSGFLLLLPADVLPASRGVFVVALLAVPLFALLNLYAGLANALSRFALSFMPTNVWRPLLFLGAIVAVWALGDPLDARRAITVQWLVFALVAAVTLGYSRKVFRRIIADAPPAYDSRLWIRTALPLLAVAVYTGYFPELMVIMVGAIVHSDQLAVFHVCFRVAMLISFGLFAVDAFAGPQITALLTSGDRVELQRVVNRATRVKFCGAALALIMLVLAGRWILLLFGPEFVAGYPVLLLLAAAQLAQAAGGSVTRLMSMSGHQDRCLVVFLAASAVALAFVVLLVPPFGTQGAAVAVLITTVFWVAWMRRLVIGLLGIRPSLA